MSSLHIIQPALTASSEQLIVHIPPSPPTSYSKSNTVTNVIGQNLSLLATMSIPIQSNSRVVSIGCKDDQGTSTKAAADSSNKEDPTETSFPEILMNILDGESAESGVNMAGSGERVIEWCAGGDSFIIRDKLAMEKDVLPKYFNSKCKFMSFVRKLYRWGFRQVDKTVTGVKIFYHPSFLRGEKQRAIKMASAARTAVGKSHPQAHVGVSSINSQQYDNGMPQGHQFSAPQVVCSRPMYPPMYGGSAAGLGRNSSVLYAAHNQLFPPRHTSFGGMTSTEMFEAAMRLERMEQQQQQKLRQMQMLEMLSKGTSNRSVPAVSSFIQYVRALKPCSRTLLADMSKIDLASEIMSRDRSLYPREALELATQFKIICQKERL